MKNTQDLLPNEEGFYGNYGGCFLKSPLKEEFARIADFFEKVQQDSAFQNEWESLQKNFIGRPSPIYFARRLSQTYSAEIYLKREDLNHTGAHKINHAMGESLLAKRMGKTKLIAETGAGQHGVAVATAAAHMGLACDIYMGAVDIEKQRPNVQKMRVLGARVMPVEAGSQTLKEAVDAAFATYEKEYQTAFYAFGTVCGPHPFPMMVEYFQQVIGKEARKQFLEQTGGLPEAVVACVGGGSNAIGIFDGFLSDSSVKLYGVEPFGKGEKTGENAASIRYGKIGILHGFQCLVLQDEDGEEAQAYSIASGLDYPGVGPKHCYLKEIGRVTYDGVNDEEALEAFRECSRLEGIIPALESSHAIAYAMKLAKNKKHQKILVNCSGRGDKDVDFLLSLPEK